MKVLLVDDDDTLRLVLEKELTGFGYEVAAFADAESALAGLERSELDLAVVDLRLPGMDGLELLGRVLALEPSLPVVVLTGHGGIPEAVAAMRAGAYDFLTKPISLEALDQTLRRANEHRELRRENERLRQLIASHEVGGTILGQSAGAREMRALVEKLAAVDENVLITGENGTGKELVACAIHEHSARREHPFVVVNCGAIPESLVESELFGHERGAFTGADRRRIGLFEAAHRGTVFLDEVGELPLSVQPKLLRAVQHGEVRRVGGDRTTKVDVRVLAATNRDLHREIDAGSFREDLFYRISTLMIEVPALRERRDDVPLLTRHFLERACPGEAPELTPDALARLRAHDWPGNVRELENAVARLSALVDGPTIDAPDVERLVLGRRRRATGELPTLDLEQLERVAILQAMRLHGGNRRQVAGELGVAVKTLYNKIQRYRISEAEYGPPPA